MTTTARLQPADAIKAENAVAEQILIGLVDYYSANGKTKEETTALLTPAINAIVESSNIGPILVDKITKKINERYNFSLVQMNKSIDRAAMGHRQEIIAKLSKTGFTDHLDSTFFFLINR